MHLPYLKSINVYICSVKILKVFMRMGVLPACICLRTTCLPSLVRAGGRCQCLEFELQMIVSHTINARNLDLLEEQSVPLTDQSSPDPIFIHFISVYKCLLTLNTKVVS